jgi:hypothetical protein
VLQRVPVTCMELTPFDSDIATRPITAVLKDINLVHTPTTIIHNIVVGCNRVPNRFNLRLKLPFTTPIITYDSCSANELVSLINRHLVTNEHLTLVEHQRKLWLDTYRHYVKVRPPKLIQTIRAEHVVLSKPPSKRRTYRQALIKLRRFGLLPHHSNIKMFIKNERMALKEPLKAPRAIQSRSPVYNICFQMYMIPYGKQWAYDEHRVCTKGLNQYEIAQLLWNYWEEIPDPVADLHDHSFYDSKEHSLCMHYRNVYIGKWFCDDVYNSLYEVRKFNKCYTRHGLSYRVVGTQLSGDGDTSDGNSTTNDMILSYVYRKIQHRRVLLGDDSVIIRPRDTNYDHQSLIDYGFKTKSNTVTEFNDIDYCQCKPVLTPRGWLMIRDPLRVISRGTICINRNVTTLQAYKNWARGVGDCEIACNPGIPVLQEFALFMQRASNTSISDPEFLFHRYRMDYNYEPVAHSTRLSFSRTFGITPAEQIGLENYFRGLNWDHISIVECAEPTPPTIVAFHS